MYLCHLLQFLHFWDSLDVFINDSDYYSLLKANNIFSFP